MIPSLQEITYRVHGAWRLARFDVSGVQSFDDSPQAALRSFFAAVLVTPAFIVMLLLSSVQQGSDHDPLSIFFVYLLGYCLTWTAFPVIAYRICQVIGRERAFFRFLSANNWTSVVVFHLQLVIVVLIVGGVVPEALVTLLVFAMYAYLIGYQWFITRHCLDVSTPAAIGFVALQFLVAFFIDAITSGIIYGAGG